MIEFKHYFWTLIQAFSKDGRSETIIPKKESEKLKMGLQKRLTRLDKLNLNTMYDCFGK